MRDDETPQPPEGSAEDEMDAALHGDEAGGPQGSFKDDILALVEDGRTYAEAELNFQKSRISFAANRGKTAALHLLFALGFIHLALIALVVGILLALAPMVGPFAATMIVVGALVIGMAIMLWLARANARDVSAAFKEGGE